jgi:hypothetical protein
VFGDFGSVDMQEDSEKNSVARRLGKKSMSVARRLGKKSMSHRLRAFLESHELSLKGIAVAVAAHEFIGLALLGATWIGCYHLQPSKMAASLISDSKVESYMEKAKQ